MSKIEKTWSRACKVLTQLVKLKPSNLIMLEGIGLIIDLVFEDNRKLSNLDDTLRSMEGKLDKLIREDFEVALNFLEDARKINDSERRRRWIENALERFVADSKKEDDPRTLNSDLAPFSISRVRQ